MTRFATALSVFALVIGGALTVVIADDLVGGKLAAAKEQFAKDLKQARGEVIGELRKKAETAQKAGDLKTIEKIEDEIKALEETGTMPMSIRATSYISSLRRARAMLADAYAEAVKGYTREGELAEAKAIQEEMEEFKRQGEDLKPKSARKKTLSDMLVAGTVLTGDYKWINGKLPNGSLRVTIAERDGKTFKGTHVASDKNVRNAASDIAGEIVGNVITYRRINSVEVFSVRIERKGDRLDGKFSDMTGLVILMTLRVPK